MFNVDNDKLNEINERVQKYLWASIVLVFLAVAAPMFSWHGLFLPVSDKPEIWFQRSGAITTIFSLFAGAGTASVLGALLPRGLTDLKLEAAREVFEVSFRHIERFAFWLTVVGTVIWGYGDLIFMYFKG